MGKNKQRGGKNSRRKIDKATRIPLVQSLESFCDFHEEASNDKVHPLYAANQIVPTYKENCPKIFPNSGNRYEENKVVPEEEEKGLEKPYYDGNYLHQLARETLGEKRVHDITLKKFVIPAYDIKKLLPIVFSSYQFQCQQWKNHPMSSMSGTLGTKYQRMICFKYFSHLEL